MASSRAIRRSTSTTSPSASCLAAEAGAVPSCVPSCRCAPCCRRASRTRRASSRGWASSLSSRSRRERWRTRSSSWRWVRACCLQCSSTLAFAVPRGSDHDPAMTTPWPRDYVPSGWNDPLDEVVTRLMPHYNSGRRRHDLDAVRQLVATVIDVPVARHIVVVGTNGMSSTAHFLATLLHARGVRAGLYTSPPIRHWNDRVQIGLEPVSRSAWSDALDVVDRAAPARREEPGDLRCFAVLTLGAGRLLWR